MYKILYHYRLSFTRAIFIPLIVLFLLGNDLPAQIGSDRNLPDSNPVTAIKSLKTGLLVVRLPGFENKIEAIETAIHEARQTRDQEYFTALLVASFTERAQLYDAYIAAINEKYNFSKVGFLFDHETGGYVQGRVRPRRSDLSTPIEQQEGQSEFILSFERVESSSAKLSILNLDLHAIPPPFPNHFISGGIATIISFFKAEHPAGYQVERMNTKLWKFFGRQ